MVTNGRRWRIGETVAADVSPLYFLLKMIELTFEATKK
jgi:hypothetical protein